VKPPEYVRVGTAAGWHFWLAAGVFAVIVAGELAGQTVRGAAGTGAWGWLALVGAGGWVVGLVWRERVGVGRAWSCWVWVTALSLVAVRLALRNGFLFGRIEFAAGQPLLFAQVPVSVPLLWWLVVGGGFLVVEGLWGEWRAGVSTLTALVAAQMALMILPVVGGARGYWRWWAVADGPRPVSGAFLGVPSKALAAWFILSLALAFGLVIMGDNWSSPEARTRRQAWAPAAVLLALTVVCFGANLFGGLWLPAAFSAANAVLFGAVVVWYLRDGRRS
jgi:Carotenoid biosynthesis protein